MRRWLLAMAVLLGAAQLATADYVVIIANLNAKSESSEGGTPGMPGGMVGTPGGMVGGPTGAPPGIPGGNIGRPGGMVGTPGGMSGMPSRPGGMIGMPGGAMGRPGMGAMGGVPGMPTMPGSGGFGNLGSFFGGPEPDADDAPYLVVTVLEVESVAGPNYVKKFEGAPPLPAQPVKFRHHLIPGAGTVTLQHKTKITEVILLKKADGKPMPSVAKQFQEEHDAVFKDKEKATAEQVLRLAKWALEHGLVGKCAEMLDKAAELDKANAVATAWAKVKADLARPLDKEDVAGAWRGKLLEGYKATQTDKHHYVVLHNSPTDSTAEVQAQLDRLENSFRAYYYWWVLNGVALPVPKSHLVAVLTDPKTDDFKRLEKHLTASPVLTDSFFARREGLAVYAPQRNDPAYQNLEAISAPYWEKFNRHELLRGTAKAGIPRGVSAAEAQEARVLAVVMAAMQQEWEATGISHETTRQLLFASELLPRNVAVPEWAQFGLASFFEVPLQSPWGGPGAPNAYYLPRYKEMMGKEKKLGATPYEALDKVVTDSFFRTAEPDAHKREVLLRQGRTGSWALMYFLAQKERDGLRRYFKELSKMPRDIELDDKVLRSTFARAFDCVDADRKVNVAKLTALANRWDSYIKNLSLEAEGIHEKIREAYARMHKEASTPPSTPGPTLPGGIGPRPPMGPGSRPGMGPRPPVNPGRPRPRGS